MITNLIGHLFDLAFSISLIDVRKVIDVIAGTFLVGGLAYGFLAVGLRLLHHTLCLIYLAMY